MAHFKFIIRTHCSITSPTYSQLSQPNVRLLGYFGLSSTTVLRTRMRHALSFSSTGTDVSAPHGVQIMPSVSSILYYTTKNIN